MVTELDLDAVLPGILRDAGEIALRWFRAAIVAPDDFIHDKGGAAGFDPVTEADRGIEDLLRARIGGHFPDHQITGEERGTTGPDGRYRWLIDPIDGTKAFVSGSPLWGIMAGLLDDDEPVAGWVHQPYLDEMFAAIVPRGSGPPSHRGEATFTHAGRRQAMHSRQTARLDTAVMYTTSPDWFRPGRELEVLERLTGAVRLVRYGGDCYSYCMIAMGQVDLVVETALAPYDIAALIPIVEAAGGVVTGIDGQPAAAGGFIVAAANARLHDEALAVIADLQ